VLNQPGRQHVVDSRPGHLDRYEKGPLTDAELGGTERPTFGTYCSAHSTKKPQWTYCVLDDGGIAIYAETFVELRRKDP
jgi:hypothetical protein